MFFTLRTALLFACVLLCTVTFGYPASTPEPQKDNDIHRQLEHTMPDSTQMPPTADPEMLRILKRNELQQLELAREKEQAKEKELQREREIAREKAISRDRKPAQPEVPVAGQSTLEKLFSRKSTTLLDKTETDPFKRELKQFGYDFFKIRPQQPGEFDNLPAGDNYILGPGDTIKLTSWGTFSISLELPVDRNGELTIPKVGAVGLSGLTLDQARESISKMISRYFKNFEINITLGKVKSINVFVVGEVETPGSYPLNSLSTVINALAAAGGPSRNGSLRTIRVMRKGALLSEVDLYDFFLSGDRSKDLKLQNGDTIHVPVIGPVVAIAGEVKRPAIYEIKGKLSLNDAITLAGGITATGFTGRIQIERFENNTSKVVLDTVPTGSASAQAAMALQIMDRDMIKIFPIQEAARQVVSLKGNAVRPGEYQFFPGMRIRDLIRGYSDLLPESYLESSEITRLSRPDFQKQIISFSLRKVLEMDETSNIQLQEQDAIRIFTRSEMLEKSSVSISGEVTNPGAFPYYPGMTVRALLSASGALKRNAFLDSAELSRVDIVNGNAAPRRLNINLGKALNGDPEHDLALQPDDVLAVRSITGWSESNDKFVQLKGEFKYPGVYSISKGEKLSSVIVRAGGFTDKSYLRGARFTRRSVRDEQQKRMEEIISRAEKDILQKQAALASVSATREELEANKATLETLMKDLERTKSLKAEGRVVIRLADLDELSRSNYDIALEGGDIIDVPPRPNVVNVLGRVFNPTSFVYLPDHALVEDYLARSGGLTRDADSSELYILRSDGTVFSRQQSSFGIKWSDEAKRWSFGGFMSTMLEPGDTLVVPQKIEQTAWMRDIKDITTILSQVALTAGTVLIGLR